MAIPDLPALPQVNTLQECADFSKTVLPFLPQLYDLPNKVFENIADPQALLQIYIDTNPFMFGLGLSILIAAIFFVLAEVNRNWSQIDRAWSILPNLYVIHFAVWARLAGESSPRVEFIVSATTIWSARLTFNYARKGGYNIGSEDYRWAIVRKQIGDVAFLLLDATFIALIQSVLIYVFAAAPTYVILLTSYLEPGVGASDWVYCGVILFLVFIEYISDGQQWEYQTVKHQYLKDAKVPNGYTQADLDRGFITTGLWSYSRHPNFAAEQLVWFVLYQWSCYSASVMGCWAFAGSGSLMMLFQGSTWLTELISSGKYPEYKHYKDKVPAFVPISMTPYQPEGPPEPKVIRTSELDKRAQKKKNNNKESSK